eukprot:CAMPEP_0181324992 /NCGR_PEP_ID=MMETSP1101-20121128/20671_1 /TAXON_ID=46948 /ORGANISM="Rhodomonas abbreviata, Strain Caron Lab Isolate" /LENGTH=265 /DNA_ID=CAMNT_0023433237 /DNA_START=21 /DNA_END=818 /DNA_ORIENTATION=-
MSALKTAALLALLAAPMVTAFSPVGLAPALRAKHTYSAISRRPASLRMSSASSGKSGDAEIDFGKVGFSDSTRQMDGMVFKPEADATEPESRCRVDWDIACEEALNDHINVEYTASYAYHALFSYFDRDTVGLDGFAQFFADQSVEERTHAEEFMKYQNTRGGKVSLKPIAVPEMQFSRVDGTSDALYAFELALQLEKFVYRKLKKMHDLATQSDDPQFCDEIEKYLGEQVKAIKDMAGYVAQIRRVGTGHGVWNLNQQFADKAA